MFGKDMSFNSLAWFTISMINRHDNPTYDKFLSELCAAVRAAEQIITVKPTLPSKASLRLLFSKHMVAFAKQTLRSDVFSEVMVHYKDASYRWTIKRILDTESQSHVYVAGVIDKISYTSNERYSKLEELVTHLTSISDHNQLFVKRVRNGILMIPSQSRK